MVKRKKKLIKIFKCPIEGCNKSLGYNPGQEAYCYHNGIRYRMNVVEVEK
jgi:hypothetical protein